MENVSRTLTATFHLTHNCNIRCGYCYTGAKFGVGMSDETAEEAVRFCLREAGGQRADLLETVFFGGEPLLRRDLLCRIADRFLGTSKDFEVTFKMSTNGLLLTEDVVRDLARRRVYVSLSVDGEPEVQDRQRPDALGRGTSDRLAPAIRRLLEWNPCANANCVITPGSADRVDRSVQWLYRRGFAYVSTTLDYGADWSPDDLRKLKAAYERLAEWYLRMTVDGRKFYLSCFDEKIRTRTRGPLDRSERCSLGYRQFSIAPSGRLYPCVQFVREDAGDEYAIGDVRSGFDETRRGRVFGCAEEDKPECGGCALLPRCASWCACVNWQSTGRIDRASPLVCEHDRILMPIADGVANRLWKRRNPLFIHKHYNTAFPVLNFMEDVIVREKRHEEASRASGEAR